jgi:hypothetical protein
MANRPWLDEVQRRLVEGDLPAAYIRRFMDELADHIEDITEDTMSTEMSALSRMGEPDHVAGAAVVAYSQRTFFGRHPLAKFLVFGFSPVVAMLLAFVAACLGMAAVGAICDQCGIRLADKSHLGSVDPTILSWGFALITTMLPAALLTFLYCRFARRFEIGKRWILASCCVLAFVAMLPFQSFVLSEVPGKNLWTIGLGFPPGLLQCVQLLVPLVAGLWFTRRLGRQSAQEGSSRVSSSRLAA